MTTSTDTQATSAERLPWTPPTVTAIDLAIQTHTGTTTFSDETTFVTASRYAPTS